MGWRDQLSDLINTDDLAPSLTYWASLLNYAGEHEKDLTLADLEYLAFESERCRLYWNSDREEVITITKNGKQLEQKMKKKGLGIPKVDVFPNIHRMIKARIQEQIRLEDDEEDLPEENSTPIVAQLVAMPYNK